MFNLWTSTWSPVGGKGWQSAYGPEVWEARDRLLAIGSTGTFHSNSGPIAEKMESYPILGAVFKLQRRRMRNRIKQNTPKAKYSKSKILQKQNTPKARSSFASTSCSSKQSVSVTRTALNVHRACGASAIIYKITRSIQMWYRIVIQSCNMRKVSDAGWKQPREWGILVNVNRLVNSAPY